jgi:NADH-quinone oxidoreductase subunit M
LSGFAFLLTFIESLYIWYKFDTEIVVFQFEYSVQLIDTYNIDFVVGLDGISLCFLLLTTFIMPLC